jgi:hypothetical protein
MYERVKPSLATGKIDACGSFPHRMSVPHDSGARSSAEQAGRGATLLTVGVTLHNAAN